MGLLHRLFKVGRMPDAIRSEIAGESVLYQAEGIRVVVRRRGRVPGAVVAGGGIYGGLGALAVTERRVIGTRGRGKLVDVPFDVATGGPASLSIDDSGLHVVFDLDRVHPSCSGEMRMDFHAELPADVLARLPLREASFPVDPQKVVRLFGSLKKLPDPGTT